ncbi:MAG TPA: hypothetical protein VEW46_12390 [Pyrinomonadaceae bacterium]|nr:hypothetical protein [Pyrinomonadaceae bacterium]
MTQINGFAVMSSNSRHNTTVYPAHNSEGTASIQAVFDINLRNP